MHNRHRLLSRRQFFASTTGLLYASHLSGHQQPTFSTGVKVVSVLAIVRDKKGSLVRGLTKNDFTLLEDGRPQTIRYFSQDSDLPLTIGLLVDTSLSQRTVLEVERDVSFHFLERVLREKQDQAFIVQFDESIFVRQEPTSSRKELEATLQVLEPPDADLGPSGTLLYDAVRLASNQKMLKLNGRKALIILSDGVDIGSHATLSDAIAAAQRADALIYSILFSDETAYGVSSRGHRVGPEGRATLERLSNETGGGFFQVSKKQTIERVFESIQEELRTQYSFGYISDQPVVTPGFRNIHLETNKKGVIVQAKDRYYAEI
jgi:VWFA-related protein